MEHPLRARHWTKGFLHIFSLHPYNKPASAFARPLLKLMTGNGGRGQVTSPSHMGSRAVAKSLWAQSLSQKGPQHTSAALNWMVLFHAL